MFNIYIFGLSLLLIIIAFAVFTRLGEISSRKKIKGIYPAAFAGAFAVLPFSAFIYIFYFIFGFIESKLAFFILMFISSAMLSDIILALILIVFIKKYGNGNLFTAISFSVSIAVGFLAFVNVIWFSILSRDFNVEAIFLGEIPVRILSAVMIGYFGGKFIEMKLPVINIKFIKWIFITMMVHGAYEYILFIPGGPNSLIIRMVLLATLSLAAIVYLSVKAFKNSMFKE